MSQPATSAAEELLKAFATYDEHVDVVSVMEWLFTDVRALYDTVEHFERYPRIPVGDGKQTLRPDFTVLFRDGTGIVGELAKVARHPNSVDKLCSQIGNYASEITHLPGRNCEMVDVTHVDVLLLVQMSIGLEVVQRIIAERMGDPKHPYKPAEPPCVVQYARQDTFYSLQRVPDPKNGVLQPGERAADLGTLLTGKNVNVGAARFTPVKVLRAFNNDPINPLYLATHLWTRTWPTEHGASKDDIVVRPSAIAERLRDDYGAGRTDDVKAALVLLERANLAKAQGNGTWKVSRSRIGRIGDRAVQRIIADRATSDGARRADTQGATPMPRRRGRSTPSPDQESLF